MLCFYTITDKCLLPILSLHIMLDTVYTIESISFNFVFSILDNAIKNRT